MGTTVFEYDRLNRVDKMTPPNPASVVTYTWDIASNLKTVSDDGGTVTYEYDEVNLVKSVTDPQGKKSEFEYNGRYLRTRAEYPTTPNRTIMTMAWDDSRRLDITRAFPADPVTEQPTGPDHVKFDYDYITTAGGTTFDTLTRYTVTDKNNVQIAYSYDKVGRLTGADSSGGGIPDFTYAYDDKGNLTQTTVNGAATSYLHEMDNALCWSVAGTLPPSPTCSAPPPEATVYNYDLSGNLTSSTGGPAMTYNVKNQTESVTPPGGPALSMTYLDGDQTRRATFDQKRFTHDLVGVSAETDQGSGNPHTTYYTRDPRGTLVGARETNGALHYFLFDGLGSVVGLVNSSGALTDTYSYEPYGKLLSSTGTAENPWRFASGYLDSPVGWLKFGARYYEPGIARWTQRDPLMGSLANPQTLNPFVYTSDNPINGTDPSGRVQTGDGWSVQEPKTDEEPRGEEERDFWDALEPFVVLGAAAEGLNETYKSRRKRCTPVMAGEFSWCHFWHDQAESAITLCALTYWFDFKGRGLCLPDDGDDDSSGAFAA